MPPVDPTPLGDEMVRRLPERKFPEPESGEAKDEPGGAPDAHEDDSEPDIAHRPALPAHPGPMAADVEDEEADPVVDAGPGIADGPKRLGKQRG